MTETIPHFIGGKRIAGKGRTGLVFNPAFGKPSASVALATAAEARVLPSAGLAAYQQTLYSYGAGLGHA